jgi:hypothetical protein
MHEPEPDSIPSFDVAGCSIVHTAGQDSDLCLCVQGPAIAGDGKTIFAATARARRPAFGSTQGAAAQVWRKIGARYEFRKDPGQEFTNTDTWLDDTKVLFCGRVSLHVQVHTAPMEAH